MQKKCVKKNFKAVKFGWQNFGLNLNLDKEHLVAAREGLDSDLMLMVDVGAIWGNNINEALKRDNMLIRSKSNMVGRAFLFRCFL